MLHRAFATVWMTMSLPGPFSDEIADTQRLITTSDMSDDVQKIMPSLVHTGDDSPQATAAVFNFYHSASFSASIVVSSAISSHTNTFGVC